MFEAQLSRSKFLKLLAKISALIFIFSKTTGCSPSKPTPALKGIDPVDYHSFRAIQEVFLKGNPIPDFDLGLALDQYIYGHPYPIETEDLIRFLASLPSSILIAFAFDFSFTPLANLSPEEMERRLLGWKSSSLAMKRGVFSILRQFSFFLLTSDKRFQQYMGYQA
jgi:hypothetical protein